MAMAKAATMPLFTSCNMVSPCLLLDYSVMNHAEIVVFGVVGAWIFLQVNPAPAPMSSMPMMV